MLSLFPAYPWSPILENNRKSILLIHGLNIFLLLDILKYRKRLLKVWEVAIVNMDRAGAFFVRPVVWFGLLCDPLQISEQDHYCSNGT